VTDLLLDLEVSVAIHCSKGTTGPGEPLPQGAGAPWQQTKGSDDCFAPNHSARGTNLDCAAWRVIQLSDRVAGEACHRRHGRRATEMNRRLFDPEHLRIAAEVRAKAWRRRWLNLEAGLQLLLIMALGVVFPFMLAQLIMLLLGQ
jgi:hypothetical protein